MARNARLITWTLALGVAAAIAPAASEGADKPGLPQWKRIVVEAAFRGEGVSTGDVNKDGKKDILVGDSWYEAPGWLKHHVRKPGDFGDGLHSYSNCMCSWTDDVNGDGWIDQIVVGFPGKPAYWYENPKGKEGYWPEHPVWESACNETPLYTDLFGDGKRVLIMAWQAKGKDRTGTMAWFVPGSDPNQPWEMHAISEQGSPSKPMPGTDVFSHGLGAADINGDGRRDVICVNGWWEQPKEGRQQSTPWTFHPAALGDAVADIVTYDVNGDGKADVINSSAHRYGIWWYEQTKAKDGSIAFVKHEMFPSLVSETHALIVADINGDGLNDFVTGKRFWSHGRNEAGSGNAPRLFWFQAEKDVKNNTTFVPREIDDDSGIGTQFVVEDFNGDGLLDVVVSNKKGVFINEQIKK